MADKAYRIPLDNTRKSVLAGMLDGVPSRKIVNYDWTSETGRAFIKAVRATQLTGVPLPWIAEALDISTATLTNAIAYWESPSSSRGKPASKRRREPRPLRRATTDDD